MTDALTPPQLTDAQTGALVEAEMLSVVQPGTPPGTKLAVFTDNVGNTRQPRPVQIVGVDGLPVVARYDYIANGVDDLAGIKAMIAKAVAAGTSAQMVVRGACALSIATGSELLATGLGPYSSLTLEGDTFRLWDPKNPDATLGGLLAGVGTVDNPCAPGFRLETQGTMRFFPELTWEGYCLTRTSDEIIVQMKPGMIPAFETMDVLAKVGLTGAEENTLYEGREGGTGMSYPVSTTKKDGTVLPADQRSVQPPLVVATPTAITNLNPVELAVVGLYDGAVVTCAGFAGGGWDTLLNGKRKVISIEDDTNPNRATLLNVDETPVDASGLSLPAPTTFGTLTADRVPTWIQPGDELLGVVRKRSQAQVDPTFYKDWTVRLNVAGATSVLFKGFGGSGDLTVGIKARGKGRRATTAGGLVTTEHRGRIILEGFDGRGVGDDSLHVQNRYWNDWLIAPLASGSISVSTKVWPPQIGDQILFQKGASSEVHPVTAAIKVTLGGVAGSTVSVVTPSGYEDGSWRIRNLSTIPEIVLGDISGEGTSRIIQLDSDDVKVGTVRGKNHRGPAILRRNPTSVIHANQGGMWRWGGQIKGIIDNNGGLAYSKDNCAISVFREIGATAIDPNRQSTLVGPSRITNYGFAALLAEGAGYQFASSLYLANPGIRRSTIADLVADPTLKGNADIIAIAAPIEIPYLNDAALFWVKLYLQYGGYVIIGNRGSHTLNWPADPGADQDLNTIPYGSHQIKAPLAAIRKVYLTRGSCVGGEPFNAKYNAATGSMVQYYDKTNPTVQIGSINNTGAGASGSRAQMRFDGDLLQWVAA